MRGDAGTTRRPGGTSPRRWRFGRRARPDARVADVRALPLPGQRRRRRTRRAHRLRGRRRLRGLPGRDLPERRRRPPLERARAGGPRRVLRRHPRRSCQPVHDPRGCALQWHDPALPHGRWRNDVVAAPDDPFLLRSVVCGGHVRGRGPRRLRHAPLQDERRGPDLAGGARSLRGAHAPDHRARGRLLCLRPHARLQERQWRERLDLHRKSASVRRHECAARGSDQRVGLRGRSRPARSGRPDVRRRVSQHERGNHVDREQPRRACT